MSQISEEEYELLELVRKHKKKETELIDRLGDPKLKHINEVTLLTEIKKNHEIGNTIRELFDEIGLLTFRNLSDLEHLKKIRNQHSETDMLYVRSIFWDLSKESERSIEDILKKVKEIEDEKHEQLPSTLDEMIDYFAQWAGDSVTFFERKKEFGTLLVARPLPPNIEPYLKYIKHCYLSNMNEAVIGLSRVLIEVACQAIYDKIPENNRLKIQNINFEIRSLEMIKKAFQYRLECQRKNTKEIRNIKDKAVDLYLKASKILHGKLPNSKTDEDTLKFVRDVFSVIEELY